MVKSEARSKLLKKLKSIDSYENFPIAIDTCLETEEECQYMLNAIESGLVENSVDITMLATTIDDERKKKGDYLKNLKFEKVDFEDTVN